MVSLNPFKWGWIKGPILRKIYSDEIKSLESSKELFTSSKRTGMDVIADGIEEYLRKGTTKDKLNALLRHFLEIHDAYKHSLLRTNAINEKNYQYLKEAAELMKNPGLVERSRKDTSCMNKAYPLMKRMRVLVLEMLLAIKKDDKRRLEGLADNYKLNVQRFKAVGRKYGY